MKDRVVLQVVLEGKGEEGDGFDRVNPGIS